LNVITQRPAISNQAQLFVLAILGGVAAWILFPLNPTILALLVVITIFLFSLRRPVWAMAALIIDTFTVSSYMVNTPLVDISLRLLLMILTGFILWRYVSRGQFSLGKNAKQIIIPVAIIVGLSVVSNLMYTSFDFAFKDFRNMVVGLLIVIFLPAVTNNLKDLKILCGIAFITITASSIVAIFQHFGLPGTGQTSLTPGFLWIWPGQPRVPGMAEDQLMLSYVLSTVILVVLGIFLVKGVTGNDRRLLGISAVLLVPALYFTYTRSAILAVLLGAITLFLLLKTRIRVGIILIALLLFAVLTQFSGIMQTGYLSSRSQAQQEGDTIGRQILFQAGLAMALNNPILGVGGGDRFETLAPQYSKDVNPALLNYEEENYWGFRTLGTTQIHNDFLGIWVSYGVFAFLAFLWLFFVMMRSLFSSYRKSNNLLIKGLSIGLAAGLAAYGINSFYHNCLTSFSLFWIIAGFCLAIAKLVERQRDMQTLNSN
jgi:O-antigen ligase